MECTIGEKEFLTTKETLSYLGIKSDKTLAKYEELGLKYHQIYKKKWYSKSEIRKFLNKHMI